MFCLLVVLVRLSVPVQVTDWKDSSPKRVDGNVRTNSLTYPRDSNKDLFRVSMACMLTNNTHISTDKSQHTDISHLQRQLTSYCTQRQCVYNTFHAVYIYDSLQPSTTDIQTKLEKHYLTRMALSTANTYTKAADATKLLLLYKCRVTHILLCAVWWCPDLTVPSPNHNPNPTTTQT